ncbi:hypothetical protein [Nocardioides gilvus]|uniref:hypothetical protein n=1 Tax=Nocardioides gilvus TaxID=1735589 RepID=UPI0013A5AD92|nr:hypothetical protein [Nocardioides gilvus]
MSPARAPQAPGPGERVVWRSPRVLGQGETPRLLAFRSDDFMVELETSLATSPAAVAARIAGPEHWSDTQPPLHAVPARPKSPTPVGLKLFQPAHQRYYLVSAHLCCRRFGFPDRRLSPSESVGFVLRRVEPSGSAAVDVLDPTSFDEFAWTPEGSAGSWQPVAQRHALGEGEELLPLVPTVHTHDARRSRLLTGLVPVGARERYEARGRAVVAQTTTTGDLLANPHRALLEGTVIEAFRQVGVFAAGPVVTDDDLEEMFLWALIDLVDFVSEVVHGSPATMADTHLDVQARATPALTWATIVKRVAAERAALQDGDPPSDELASDLESVRDLDVATLITRLISYRGTVPAPPTPPAAPTGDPDPVRGLEYVARCVYRRLDCPTPRPEWVSPPTVPFRFASFFDPDAPARPVQISLPFDTSPAGLRSFPRNVSVVISKQLRAQIQQVRGLDDIGGKPTFDLGMVCQLSIPIITICALILLMVVVSLLNIVFFWVPFFKICLPKPGGD